MSKRKDVIEKAREIIRSRVIEPGQASIVREAALALKQNGTEVAPEDRRIIDATINIYGTGWDAPPPSASPFDDAIAEREAEIAQLEDAYREARERFEAAAREIGGPLVLDGGRVQLKMPSRPSKLEADEERALYRRAEVLLAAERQAYEELEQRGAELRGQIRLLTRAAMDWQREQAEKNSR